MNQDIGAMFWKEWREILTLSGIRGRFGVIVISVMFGIVLPLQQGRDWVTDPLFIIFWFFVPFLIVSSSIVDVFAGERERHTLETLLASRLKDSAILLGKAFAGATYGVAFTWLNLLISLLTVNIVFSAGKLLVYSLPVTAAILVFSVLMSFLATNVGILISLRASSVRQAQQTISIIMLLFLVLPVIGTRLLPPIDQAQLNLMLESFNPLSTALIAGSVLLVADLLLLVAAMARFKRAKLILD